MSDNGQDVVVYVPMMFYIGKRFILKTSLANTFKRGTKLGWMPHRFKVKLAFRITDPFIRDADVTIATAWYTAPFVNALSKRKGSKVYFIQDYEVWNQDENEVNATYRMDMYRIVITNNLKKLLKEKLGVNSTPVYNGHDSREYITCEKVKNNPKRVMMLWNNSWYKGTKEAMEILGRLHEKYGIRVILFSVDKIPQIPPFVDFYQRPERTKLIQLYQASDIYLFPSRQEAWGLPVMEAMANKCAVVGMNTGMLADVCTNGIQALIAKNGDYETLEHLLETVLSDDFLMKQLQENGYQFSLDYSWDKQCKLFESELIKAVQSARKLT